MRSDRHLVRLTSAMILAFFAWMLPSAVLAHQGHAAGHGPHAAAWAAPSSPVFTSGTDVRIILSVAGPVARPPGVADAACGATAPACCTAPLCCPACILSDPGAVPARTARRRASRPGDAAMRRSPAIEAIPEPPRARG